MQKITPHLWFDKEAEAAANFYVSVFNGSPAKKTQSKIGKTSYYGKAGYEIHGMPEGTVMTVELQLEGQDFIALNAGPVFKFNEAISFLVDCETQAEVDYFWEQLSADPKSEQCGWLKDKYGLSWQIVPTILSKLISDPDPTRSGRVMEEMLKMKKIDIAGLRKTAEQK